MERAQLEAKVREVREARKDKKQEQQAHDILSHASW